MKSIVTFFVAMLIGVCALGAEPTNRPVGVEPDSWIQVTENLGFVVVSTTESTVPRIQGPNPQILLNKISPEAPATGYFMIKSENGWRRLVVMTPADIATAASG